MSWTFLTSFFFPIQVPFSRVTQHDTGFTPHLFCWETVKLIKLFGLHKTHNLCAKRNEIPVTKIFGPYGPPKPYYSHAILKMKPEILNFTAIRIGDDVREQFG
jgi:hypothetical protein